MQNDPEPWNYFPYRDFRAGPRPNPEKLLQDAKQLYELASEQMFDPAFAVNPFDLGRQLRKLRSRVKLLPESEVIPETFTYLDQLTTIVAQTFRQYRWIRSHESIQLDDSIPEEPQPKPFFMNELIALFAGFQALGSLLQVLVTEKNSQAAVDAYKKAAKQAVQNPDIQARAKRLSTALSSDPVSEAIFRNHIGRCLDSFQSKLREEMSVNKLLRLTEAHKLCRCKVLEALNSHLGYLPEDLQAIWEADGCPVRLRDSRSKRP